MSTRLSPRDRYRILAGDTFGRELALGVGQQLRIDTKTAGLPAAADSNAATKTQVLTATADGVSAVLSEKGQYYLAWREDADATRWCPAGVVDALPLLDEQEQSLREELDFLSDRIGKLESFHHSVSAADGTSLSRTNLPQLRRQRANAEARLGDYLRRRRGLSPARMRA